MEELSLNCVQLGREVAIISQENMCFLRDGALDKWLIKISDKEPY
jgi:hypothetical protein